MQRDTDDPDAPVADRVRRIVSEVEEVDFERIDPPADVWQGIEASITSDPGPLSTSETLHRSDPAAMVVDYWIDADDVVIDVGHSWADFARDNQAPELAVPTPDRTLWAYFDNDETRELWRLVVERVRAAGKGTHVPLRCDAPHARRWFDMTVTPDPAGTVHFRCALASEEARSPVALLDRRAERDDELQPVPLCSWCGRGQHGSAWLDIEALVQTARLLERTSLPAISYGICGSCRDGMSAELLVPSGVGESTA